MVKPVLALVASSLLAGAAPPLRLLESKTPFAAPMFHPKTTMNQAEALTPGRRSAPISDRGPTRICHIIVIPADPGIDPKMAVKAPADIDPKIVQKSACAAPLKD